MHLRNDFIEPSSEGSLPEYLFWPRLKDSIKSQEEYSRRMEVEKVSQIRLPRTKPIGGVAVFSLVVPNVVILPSSVDNVPLRPHSSKCKRPIEKES